MIENFTIDVFVGVDKGPKLLHGFQNNVKDLKHESESPM